MAKNLKDIVDEGFTKLAEIGEKRKEILARSESISTISAKKSDEFEQRLSALEKTYVSEISTQVDSLLEDLRQTLVQVADNKELFQGSIKESLKLEIAGILKNATQAQDNATAAASERLDAIFLKVDKKFAAEKLDFSYEAEKISIELERLVRKNRTAMNHLHSESTGTLSEAKNQHKSVFGENLTAIVKSAESSRIKAGKAVEDLFDEQTDDLAKASKKLDSKVSKSVAAALDALKDTCKTQEKNVEESVENVISKNTEELKSLSKDSLSELQASCDSSRQELTDKLNELKEFSQRLLSAGEQSMSEKEEATKNNAVALCSDLKSVSGASSGDGLGAVEEAFTELSSELEALVKDLKKKLQDLLSAYDEGMTKLGQASERSFSDVFANYKTQLTELIKIQDQLCIQKEDDLHSYLAKLEKQINETSSQLEGAGNSGGKK